MNSAWCGVRRGGTLVLLSPFLFPVFLILYLCLCLFLILVLSRSFLARLRLCLSICLPISRLLTFACLTWSGKEQKGEG